jgi:hypothetical protein
MVDLQEFIPQCQKDLEYQVRGESGPSWSSGRKLTMSRFWVRSAACTRMGGRQSTHLGAAKTLKIFNWTGLTLENILTTAVDGWHCGSAWSE